MAGEIEWICEDIVPDCKLPGDVMVSILTYLPVKSLLKFKSVSKPWCSFISSPRFCKLHLHRQSLIAPNNWLMSLMNISRFGLLNLSHDYSTPVDAHVLMLEIPLSFDPTIIDSCNGLVCLGELGSDDLILWNPATRRYRSLHLPEGVNVDIHTLSICYVDATNDFKILVWNNTRPRSPVNTPYLCVYSLSSDSWDIFDFYAPKTVINFDRPTFMGRCMQWLATTCPNGIDCTCSSGREIVAFDVMDGAMCSFHIPVNCGRHQLIMPKTLVIRGCLSIVIYCGIDRDGDSVDAQERGYEVWVMEEYGVERSWVKRFFIQQEFIRVSSLCLRSYNNCEIVFLCISGGRRVLLFYDPYSKKKSYVEFKSLVVFESCDYVESLASVGTS